MKILLGVLLAATASYAQSSAALDTAKQSALIDDLRARYYRPSDLGLISFSCTIKYDIDTLPPAFVLPAEVAGRTPLDATQLTLTMDRRGPTIKRVYPAGVSDLIKPLYDRLFDVAQSVALGFFQTWAPKAIASPVPYSTGVLSVTPSASMYSIRLPNPGQKVTALADHELLVKEIRSESQNQTIDEHPTFTPSPQGLLFTGNDTQVQEGEDKTHVVYTVDYQTVDTFLLPHAVHIMVNDTIDTRFSLEHCKPTKGIVLNVKPPPQP